MVRELCLHKAVMKSERDPSPCRQEFIAQWERGWSGNKTSTEFQTDQHEEGNLWSARALTPLLPGLPGGSWKGDPPVTGRPSRERVSCWNLLFWLPPHPKPAPGHSSQEPQGFATLATESAPSLSELVPLLHLFAQEEPAFESPVTTPRPAGVTSPATDLRLEVFQCTPSSPTMYLFCNCGEELLPR